MARPRRRIRLSRRRATLALAAAVLLWGSHGARDTITPLELGERLFAAACQPTRLLVFAGAGHATAWTLLGKAFEDQIAAFLDEVLEQRPR